VLLIFVRSEPTASKIAGAFDSLPGSVFPLIGTLKYDKPNNKKKLPAGA
jgi:hypothetical protein